MMTSFDKYKDEIGKLSRKGFKFALVNGKITNCDTADCLKCAFIDKCSAMHKFLWLLEDDGEPSSERIAGQNEAWELARKILSYPDIDGYTTDEFQEIFEVVHRLDAIVHNTYAEAAEKVKAWEESKKIKRGDVVRHKEFRVHGVVFEPEDDVCMVLTSNGSMVLWGKDKFDLVGRTLPVTDWLQQIGGSADES